ncbi:MAG TPA: MerR family transcriptional regulator [Trebonia sp.]|nr:MerR family transcriptional regulator [Trebonia sp.]
MEPFEDENIPLYTVGQVAEMLSLKQAFLRRIDELQVVSPQRSAGRQRRYTRVEIRVIRQVATMADEGMTMPAIRRIIELEQELAEVIQQRDDLAARLSEVAAERIRLLQQLALLRRRAEHDQQPDSELDAPPPGLAAGEEPEHNQPDGHQSQQPGPERRCRELTER